MATNDDEWGGELRAVVHIGPIKTGSSAFTAQMTASQELGKLGKNIVYALPRAISQHNELKMVKPERIRHLAPQLQWSRETGGVRLSASGSKNVFGEQALAYLDDLVKEFRTQKRSGTTVFFVEETLSRRPCPGNLTKELLDRFDAVDFVVVARAHQYIIPSAISQRVKVPIYPSVWDARVSTYLSNQNFTNQFDYANILVRWESSDPRVRVIMVPFLESDRGTQNLFYRILNAVGVRADLGEPVQHEVNVTPSRLEIGAISFYKRVSFRFSRNGLRHGSRDHRVFHFVTRLFRRIARVIDSPRWGITSHEKINIIDFYQPANLRLREMLGDSALAKDWADWFRQT
jgi:hypothetical protein